MMDSSKHTPMISPLPWEGGTCHIIDATGETIAQCFRSLSGDKQANSDFIVRAVNSHDQWAKWIVHRGPGLPDYACADCVPNSHMLQPGFQCVYHEALAAAGA